jgi:DNA-binding response OmpR family regulator
VASDGRPDVEGDRQRRLEAGRDDYLGKPLKTGEW